MIRTDTLNESGFVENTLAAMKGRTIHAFTLKERAVVMPLILSKCVGKAMLSFFYEPNPAIYGQHARRTFGYVDGLPSFRPVYSRGCRFC